MGGRGCPGLLVEVRAGGIGTTRVTSSWSQTEDPGEHSLGGRRRAQGLICWGPLYFFKFYQFMATKPSPSTLMHACSVM